MTDKTEKVAVDPEPVFKRPRECDSPSYQKRQRMALLARKQGAGDSLTAGSSMSKEKTLPKGTSTEGSAQPVATPGAPSAAVAHRPVDCFPTISPMLFVPFAYCACTV
ncbi:hypothetical protein H8959_000377 [Pygathrix nigripes]